MTLNKVFRCASYTQARSVIEEETRLALRRPIQVLHICYLESKHQDKRIYMLGPLIIIHGSSKYDWLQGKKSVLLDLLTVFG